LAFPPGFGQAIIEAPDLGPRARILIYEAGVEVDPTRWIAFEV
jgi:hypothetical protein